MPVVVQALFLIGGLLAVIVLHEAAHLVAVVLSGFRWTEFAAGPVLLRRTSRGTKAEFRGQWHAGYVAYEYCDRRSTRIKECAIAASGIAVNLVAGLLLDSLFHQLDPRQDSLWYWWLPFLSTASLLTAVGNCIPFHIPYTTLESDGMRLVKLLKPRPKPRRYR